MQNLSNLPEIVDCANALINRFPGKQDIDLLALGPLFVHAEGVNDVINGLTAAVEGHSDGEFTIRRANANLFAHHSHFPEVYLVLCPYSTPAASVAEFSSSMVPATISAREGLFVNAERATPSAATAYRRSEDESQATLRYHATVSQAANRMQEALLTRLTAYLIEQAQAANNDTAARNIDTFRYGRSYVELDKLCWFAATMEIDIHDVLNLPPVN